MEPLRHVAGLLLAATFGAVCAWSRLPAPAPPTLYGALLVVGATSGYIITTRLLGR